MNTNITFTTQDRGAVNKLSALGSGTGARSGRDAMVPAHTYVEVALCVSDPTLSACSVLGTVAGRESPPPSPYRYVQPPPRALLTACRIERNLPAMVKASQHRKGAGAAVNPFNGRFIDNLHGTRASSGIDDMPGNHTAKRTVLSVGSGNNSHVAGFRSTAQSKRQKLDHAATSEYFIHGSEYPLSSCALSCGLWRRC